VTKLYATSGGDYDPNNQFGGDYSHTLRHLMTVAQAGDTIVFYQYSTDPAKAGIAYGAGETDLLAPLVITAGVTIDGQLPAGFGPSPGGTETIRAPAGVTVLELDHADVTLENLTITQGVAIFPDTPANMAVGGLDIEGGTVNLDNLVITGNLATNSTVPAETAGGIKIAQGANVTILDSRLNNNQAYAAQSGVAGYDAAGGILVDSGTLHIVDTRIDGSGAFGGDGGTTPSKSYQGGYGAGGLLIKGGGDVTITGGEIYRAYGRGGTGGSGYTDVGGGTAGVQGGTGVGAIAVENGSVKIYSTLFDYDYGTGGTGGRGGSPIGYTGHNSSPGTGGSAGGAGGMGIGAISVNYSTGVAAQTGLRFGGQIIAHGGTGGQGGFGGNGISPGPGYVVNNGTGGGTGGAGAATSLGGSGAANGQNGTDNGSINGGLGGLPGEPGAHGYSGTVAENSPGFYLGGAGGGGGGGGIAFATTRGQIDTIQCFASGTLIATPDGQRSVETLQPGDLVTTASGKVAPIVFAGYRHVPCRHHPAPEKVWPVRVRAGAFGPGLPARDLILSPDHAVFLDDVLIPIRHLINGRSIVQESREQVTYHHIELPRHDLLLAEALPVESFLDTGGRASFANGGAVTTLHPDFGWLRWETEGYAPLIATGPHLAAARTRLDAIARSLEHERTKQPARVSPVVAYRERETGSDR
jgi:collagen type I alpha